MLPSDNSDGITNSFQSIPSCLFIGVMFPDGICLNFNLYSKICDKLSVCQIKLWVIGVEANGDGLNIEGNGLPVSSITEPLNPSLFSARHSYIPRSVSLTFLIVNKCFVVA